MKTLVRVLFVVVITAYAILTNSAERGTPFAGYCAGGTNTSGVLKYLLGHATIVWCG